MATDSAVPPAVLWAQRKDKLYITMCIDDVQNGHVLNLEPDKLYFKGVGGAEKRHYEVTIDFFKEVDPDKSKLAVLPRNITMMIMKKEEGPYWDRLLKDKRKVHWLKTDFAKWVDEDDSDTEEGSGGDANLEQVNNLEMMAQMGNFNAGGGPSGDMGNVADDEDSDDEELPDLE